MNHFKEKAMKCVFLIAAVGSVSDLCISVCKWCPGYRENRSAEVPAGNKVEAVK